MEDLRVEGVFLAEPAAEFDGGPVELAGKRGIVNDGQDFRLDVCGGEIAWTSVAGGDPRENAGSWRRFPPP